MNEEVHKLTKQNDFNFNSIKKILFRVQNIILQ